MLGSRVAPFLRPSGACTDVTGFGLLGHLRNVTVASGCAATVRLGQVPVLEAAWTYVRRGIAPGGTHANRRYLAEFVDYDEGIDERAPLVLCDAQTSGGLLIAVDPAKADRLCAALRARGAPCAAIVGALEAGPPGRTRVTP